MRFISDLTLIDGENSFLLKKRIALLKAIDEVGSLNLAAKLVPLSYKGAWDMIDVMNNLCPMPIVEKNTGGVGGGGTKLTKYGKNLVKTYEIIEKEHQKFLETISLIQLLIKLTVFSESLILLNSIDKSSTKYFSISLSKPLFSLRLS